MTIKKYDSHADWLADRRASTLLGATDIPTIMGHGFGDRTAWSVWLDKLDKDGMEPEREPSQAMRIGLAAEPIILEWIAQHPEEVSGDDIVPGPWAVTYGALRVSPDVLIYDDGDVRGIVEIKTAAPMYRHEWAPTGTVRTGPLDTWDDGYPCKSTYLWQVYAQAAAVWGATGRVPTIDIVVAFVEPVMMGIHIADDLPPIAIHEIRVLTIIPDPDDLQAVLDIAGRWYHDHVVGRVQPPLDGSPECRLHLLRDREPRSEVRDATEDEAARIAAILDARAAEAASVAQRLPQEAELIALMGRAKTVRAPAGKATISASGRLTLTPAKES